MPAKGSSRIGISRINQSEKQVLQNAISRLSEDIAAHFDGLLTRDINDANIVIFENSKREYINNVKNVITGIIKQAVLHSAVTVN